MGPSQDRTEAKPPGAGISPLAARQLQLVLLTLLLIASFALKLHNLGHLALKGLDESFHAIVAANLLEHPFTPVLIERPFLPYDYRDWQNNHVWLHKGIVPLWQIAISYRIFGVETFGLRFPSALLSTLAVLLTYLIGRELVNRAAALVAAALQAFVPAIVSLVHGYVFSDHIDIALLFWVEVGIWLVVRTVRTGAISAAILAGAAQAIAFHSKMYPALIIGGVALAAWMLPKLRLAPAEQARLRGRHVAAMWIATILLAAPWLISIAARFPAEFRHEYWLALRHLGTDVEGWAAPWDRLIFGHLLGALRVFHPMVLAAAALLLMRVSREKEAKLWLVHAWAWGVLIPFTIATSKTPSATLIGWPALLLLLGAMISRAARGDRIVLGAWLVAVVLVVCFRGEFRVRGMGGAAGQILRENLWTLWHLLAAVVAGVVAYFIPRKLWRPNVALALVVIAGAGSLWLGGLWVRDAWAVVQFNEEEPNFMETARFARQRLRPEAVLLLEERQKLERNTLMFRSRRTTYPVTEEDWRQRARAVVANGGVPFVVSDRPFPLRPIFTSRRDGRTLYQVTPQDLGLRAGTHTPVE